LVYTHSSTPQFGRSWCRGKAATALTSCGRRREVLDTFRGRYTQVRSANLILLYNHPRADGDAYEPATADCRLINVSSRETSTLTPSLMTTVSRLSSRCRFVRFARTICSSSALMFFCGSFHSAILSLNRRMLQRLSALAYR
jgi:hypothetical protein